MSVSETLVQEVMDVLNRERKAIRDHYPFKDALLRLLRTTAQQGKGEETILKIKEAMEKLFDGEPVHLQDITDDLWIASDILAFYQTMEASSRRVVRDWVVLIIQEILTILRRVL